MRICVFHAIRAGAEHLIGVQNCIRLVVEQAVDGLSRETAGFRAKGVVGTFIAQAGDVERIRGFHVAARRLIAALGLIGARRFGLGQQPRKIACRGVFAFGLIGFVRIGLGQETSKVALRGVFALGLIGFVRISFAEQADNVALCGIFTDRLVCCIRFILGQQPCQVRIGRMIPANYIRLLDRFDPCGYSRVFLHGDTARARSRPDILKHCNDLLIDGWRWVCGGFSIQRHRGLYKDLRRIGRDARAAESAHEKARRLDDLPRNQTSTV